MSESTDATSETTEDDTEERRKPTDDVPEEEQQEIEEEREQRLDPENRPHNAEVDNTQRDFDFEAGEFQDDDDESDLSDEERQVAEGGDQRPDL